ncbi:MAG: hypothetical protein ACR2NP_09445 [Pirellulaceae bacterium]
MDQSVGDIVNLSTSTPTGTADRANANDFVGLLSGVSPEQIGGLDVSFNGSLPAGEAFQAGDLVARDFDATTGSQEWEFLLTLPGDAVPGTGLEDIIFTAHAYERTGNQLENDDLTWELFLNTDTAFTLTDTTGGDDFGTHDVNWNSVPTGGATINQVRVVVTINGFDASGEWFGAYGTLSANYNAVPEPGTTVVCLVGCLVTLSRRRWIM